MTDFLALAERYLQAWNEPDPAVRRAVVDEIFVPDARYCDPLVDLSGRDAIVSLIGTVQGQLGGLRLELASEVDCHHRLGRFTWEVRPVGQEPVVVGFDVVEVDDDDRILRVLGFLDKAPVG
jgi:hypothetical protein